MSKPVLLVGAAIAAGLILLAALTGAFWSGSRATAAALDDHGAVAVATVEAKHVDTRRVRISDGTRLKTDYLVTYAFDAVSPNGTGTIALSIEQEIPRSDFDRLRTGDEVEIRYLPENPMRGDFYPGQSARAARVLGWATVIMLAAAVAVLGVALSLARTARPNAPATGSLRPA